jgi:hypothetical protein
VKTCNLAAVTPSTTDWAASPFGLEPSPNTGSPVDAPIAERDALNP